MKKGVVFQKSQRVIRPLQRTFAPGALEFRNLRYRYLVTFAELMTAILEYTVTLPKEEEGGLSLKEKRWKC